MSHEMLLVPEFTLPENTHELLTDALIPAEKAMASSANVPKFLVQDHPDLFVRSEWVNGSVDEIVEKVEEARRLRLYGVNVLPSCLATHENQTYIVTRFVTGEELPHALRKNPNRHLHQMTEANWSGIARNLADAKRNTVPVVSDVEGPHQYMLGNLPDEIEQRLWLVDFPSYSYDPSDSSEYAWLAFALANGIVATELSGNGRMEHTRLLAQIIIEEAATQAVTPLGKAHAEAAKYVLENQVEITDDEDEEDFIERFSTK